MPIERRLQAMVRRGSLVSVGKQRWVVLPPGASTIEQAAPLKTLLAAKFEGRVDWYLGYLSALADHGLDDEQASGAESLLGRHSFAAHANVDV